jgi:hypothetical protein
MRMQLYSRYASLVAGEYAALEAGEREAAQQLGAERDLVRDEWDELAQHAPLGGIFAELLADASHEQAHRDAVDRALRDELSALSIATARVFETDRPHPVTALVAHRFTPMADGTPPPGHRVDCRL